MNPVSHKRTLTFMAVLTSVFISTTLTAIPLAGADGRMAGSRHTLRPVEEPTPRHSAVTPTEQPKQRSKTDAPAASAESKTDHEAAPKQQPGSSPRPNQP